MDNIDSDGLEILRVTARHLLKEFVHPRDFFGKMIKPKQEVKTSQRVFRLDLLAVKDFYLKIKIANIRKVLTENESLNRELCLDLDSYPQVFNVKNLVSALEDIAEAEQPKMA